MVGAPASVGADTFEGTIVHPQHWPEDLDYAGKKVVVVGDQACGVSARRPQSACAA